MFRVSYREFPVLYSLTVDLLKKKRLSAIYNTVQYAVT